MKKFKCTSCGRHKKVENPVRAPYCPVNGGHGKMEEI
jgi:hypothetical protein